MKWKSTFTWQILSEIGNRAITWDTRILQSLVCFDPSSGPPLMIQFYEFLASKTQFIKVFKEALLWPFYGESNQIRKINYILSLRSIDLLHCIGDDRPCWHNHGQGTRTQRAFSESTWAMAPSMGILAHPPSLRGCRCWFWLAAAAVISSGSRCVRACWFFCL